MISGRIDDKQFWVTCPAAIQQMLELLSDPAIEQKGEGRHEVNGDMFYVLMHYDSAPLEQVPPETHKKYIDVQFVRRGQESMLWAPLRKEESKQNGEPGSQISVPYNPEKDVQYYQLPSPYTLLPCPAGSVNVFFPNDIHAPGVICHLGSKKPQRVQKIVGKVAVHLVLGSA